MRIKRISHNVGHKIAGSAMWMMGTGALLCIWGGVWLAYLFQNSRDSEVLFFVATGLLLSGLDLGLIGFYAGKIGRTARDNEKPKDVVAAHSQGNGNRRAD